MYLSQLTQILTISMQTGLRQIMDPEGVTVVISSTGIILIRSPFPLSALYLSHNSLISCLLNYVLMYHRHTWIKQKKIPPGAWTFVSCECCVLSGRGLCDNLITRPEESYQTCCVVVCDLETSWMRRPWPTGGCRAKNNNILETHNVRSVVENILLENVRRKYK